MENILYYSKKNIEDKVFKLCEEEVTSYKLESGTIQKDNTHKHDTTFRKILMNKSEAIIVINTALDLEGKNKIKEQDLQLYNNRFITKHFKNKETDVIYKMKKKPIFFLIEHQSSIDYNMPTRMLEYKVEIMRQWREECEKNNEEYKNPLVEAIVVYTGKEKWTVPDEIEETQPKLTDSTRIGIYRKYDVNKYNEKEKLEAKGILLKIAMLDIAKGKKM